MGLGRNSRQVFGFKGLAGKVFINQELRRSVRFAQDFGSELALSPALRVTPAKRLNLETAPIRSLSLSLRGTGLKSMDFDEGWLR